MCSSNPKFVFIFSFLTSFFLNFKFSLQIQKFVYFGLQCFDEFFPTPSDSESFQIFPVKKLRKSKQKAADFITSQFDELFFQGNSRYNLKRKVATPLHISKRKERRKRGGLVHCQSSSLSGGNGNFGPRQELSSERTPLFPAFDPWVGLARPEL